MLWLYLALLAYFINSIVFIIDKYLLGGSIPRPYAYAFGVSVLSASAVLLIPFGIFWHGFNYFFTALLSGAAFFGGLIFLYRTIRESDASVAATQIGAFGAIFTYAFSIAILKSSLPFPGLTAFVFMILGILLLGKLEKRIFVSAILAGALTAVYFVLLKLTFNSSDFINGLFWTRVGFIGSAFLSLFSERAREQIRTSYRQASAYSKGLFIFNKILAGAGFIILYLAIRLGNVSLINAMLGFQFLFIFVVALALGGRISELKEKINRQILVYKITGMASILFGLFTLFL